MGKYKNRKNLIFSIVLLMVLIIGIGYAYLTSNLSIIGQAEVVANTWDIHFENLVVSDGSITAVSPAAIDTNETTVNFSIKLERPGDFYEFVVDAVNDGSLDGMIGSISNVELTANQLQYLNYSFTYSDGAVVSRYDRLLSNTSETFKVRVEYKKDLDEDDLPDTNQELSLSISLGYLQADSNARERDIIPTVGTNKNNFLLGDYVDIDTSILAANTTIGDNETVLSDWRVFNKDENGILLILADYMSLSAFDVTSVGLSILDNNKVKTSDSRILLLDGLNNSNWINLINDSNIFGKAGVTVKGAPTLEAWVASWNSNEGYTHLYYAQKTPAMSDGLYGYYLNSYENPNGYSASVSGNVGYNDSLYFPHKTYFNSVYSYWLLTPSGETGSEIYSAIYNGAVNGYVDCWDGAAIRPVVYLPNNIKISQENNIWVVNE